MLWNGIEQKTSNKTGIRKYKECKKALEKPDDKSTWYVNIIIEADEPNDDHYPKRNPLGKTLLA